MDEKIKEKIIRWGKEHNLPDYRISQMIAEIEIMSRPDYIMDEDSE